MKRLISLVLVAALSFFSFMVYAEDEFPVTDYYLSDVALASFTAAFTKILACVGETATAITGSPFLLFTVIFLFAGGVIGIMGRILSRN